MVKKFTFIPAIEQVMLCIEQYEGIGASASEVSDEIKLPLREVIKHVRSLEAEGKVSSTRTLRPWKSNVSKELVDMRRVYVALNFKEEAV